MEIKNKVMECKEGNGQWKPVKSTAAVGSIDEQAVHESSPAIDPHAGLKLRGIPPDLRYGTSYLRSTTSKNRSCAS